MKKYLRNNNNIRNNNKLLDESNKIHILNVRLSHIDGFALFEKIRDLDSKVKVCFMADSTAHDEEFLNLFPIWNTPDFFHKPLMIRDLIEHIKEIEV